MKHERDGKLQGEGLEAGRNKEDELGISEWMLLTLDLKKSMKLLHLSSVASVEEGGYGLRRCFMVVKSCLELPVVLLIRFE